MCQALGKQTETRQSLFFKAPRLVGMRSQAAITAGDRKACYEKGCSGSLKEATDPRIKNQGRCPAGGGTSAGLETQGEISQMERAKEGGPQ